MPSLAGRDVSRSNFGWQPELEAISADISATKQVTARQLASAYAVVAFMMLAALVCTPFAAVQLSPIPGYMTSFGSVMIVINLLLAVLLFSKGAIQKRGDVKRLGTAYLFVAVIFVPLVASFPGGIMPGSIIGTPLSAVWLWSFWHAGFALCVARYAWLAGRQSPRSASPVLAIACVSVACVALTIVATALLRFLPSTMADGHTLFSGFSGWIPIGILVLVAGALALVCKLGARTPEQLWLAVAMVAAFFDVWLTYRGVERFSLGWYVAKLASLFTSLAILVSLLHEVTLLHARVAAANAVLSNLVHIDGLTGLNNRRRFDDLIEQEWRRAQREQQPVSLLMIDVDFFKKYNDRYGHIQGDDCLRRISGMLGSAVSRPGDAAARYGGEEFAILLPATDADGAIRVADRVRSRVHALGIPHAESPLGFVTLSMGLATAVPGNNTSMDEMLADADRALYRAKLSGRDQVRWADDRTILTGADLMRTLSADGAGPKSAGRSKS